MEALYFGDGGEQLFGVYSEPASTAFADVAVLICNPVGQEYLRSHRALHQLAADLSEQGFPVLRFDYSGSGDSSGEAEQGNVERWREDILTAAEELCATSGIDELSIVGLRLGATLAATTAFADTPIRDLVLWDPVVSGAEYLRVQTRMHRRMLRDLDRFRFRRSPRLHATDNELLGFAIGAECRRQLGQLDLCQGLVCRPERVRLLASREQADYRALADSLIARQVDCSFQTVADAGDWHVLDTLESALIVQTIPKLIGELLAEHLP